MLSAFADLFDDKRYKRKRTENRILSQDNYSSNSEKCKLISGSKRGILKSSGDISEGRNKQPLSHDSDSYRLDNLRRSRSYNSILNGDINFKLKPISIDDLSIINVEVDMEKKRSHRKEKDLISSDSSVPDSSASECSCCSSSASSSSQKTVSERKDSEEIRSSSRTETKRPYVRPLMRRNSSLEEYVEEEAVDRSKICEAINGYTYLEIYQNNNKLYLNTKCVSQLNDSSNNQPDFYNCVGNIQKQGDSDDFSEVNRSLETEPFRKSSKISFASLETVSENSNRSSVNSELLFEGGATEVKKQENGEVTEIFDFREFNRSLENEQLRKTSRNSYTSLETVSENSNRSSVNSELLFEDVATEAKSNSDNLTITVNINISRKGDLNINEQRERMTRDIKKAIGDAVSNALQVINYDALIDTVYSSNNENKSIILDINAEINKNENTRKISTNSYKKTHVKRPVSPHFLKKNLPIKTVLNEKTDEIVNEILKTEEKYVASLKSVVEDYIPEMKRPDIPQGLRGQKFIVFGNVEKIYQFHNEIFLKELRSASRSLIEIAKCFLRNDKKFELYGLYNKNKPKSDQLMSEYGYFFLEKQMDLQQDMNLASQLLKPVQRLMRYSLLLEKLIENCDESSARKPLHEAKDLIVFHLRHGEDLIMMDAIRGCIVNLNEQGRLLRQDLFEITYEDMKKTVPGIVRVFLFEELILLSVPCKNNSNEVLYKKSIKMTDVGLTDYGDKNKFIVWFRKYDFEKFILEAASPEIKDNWVKDITNILLKQAETYKVTKQAELRELGIHSQSHIPINEEESDEDEKTSNKKYLYSSLRSVPGELSRTKKRKTKVVNTRWYDNNA